MVDLMFEYVNRNDVPTTKVQILELLPQLEEDCWGGITQRQVIENPDISQEHNDRIQNADMSYPIMIDKSNNIVVDGMHRLAKAYLDKLEVIDAYVFDKSIMEKFAIGQKMGDDWTDRDWEYYDSLTEDDIEKIYLERFGQTGGRNYLRLYAMNKYAYIDLCQK
jgi:hypothetical protein